MPKVRWDDVVKWGIFMPWGRSSLMRHWDNDYKQYNDPKTIQYKDGSMAKRKSASVTVFGGQASSKRARTRSMGRIRRVTRYRRGRRGASRKRTSSYGARARRQIGERVGTHSAKTKVVEDAVTTFAMSTRTLYNLVVSEVLEGTERNERVNDKVNFRGIKVFLQAYNALNTPVNFHVAYLSPKVGQTIDTTDFFRSERIARGRNFATIELSSLEMRTLPINTDRYVVLKHMRMRLAAATEASTIFEDGGRPSLMTAQFYLPIKRQLRFEGPGSDTPIDGKSLWFIGATFLQQMLVLRY
ncbi:putative capsid protein [McMurdo Ice Shelf pond-associated circular DNA virus-1]|uniref:putative capsid protein n=1 Tax=McMurdo Ice Shelf pond-associated circular DNA virus-1 TaxID=1521385 RepID=UPI0004D16178|nr:putative capsid protein [McMurdo Ice Shelf pond-associated circular DNA virus-1]AIF71500.1 putative capsid protein [McMurdo Ice Shelf pond-associated circular DNA virus-1]